MFVLISTSSTKNVKNVKSGMPLEKENNGQDIHPKLFLATCISTPEAAPCNVYLHHLQIINTFCMKSWLYV